MFVWEREHFFQCVESVVFYSYVTLIVTLVINIRNFIYSHNVVSDMEFFPVSLPANPVLMLPAFQIFSLHDNILLCQKRVSRQFCILQAQKYQDLQLPDEVEEKRSFTFPFQNMPFYSLHCTSYNPRQMIC